MDSRPKRQSTIEKDYRERKRSRRISSSEMTGGVSGGLRDEADLYNHLHRLYNDILQLRDANDDEYMLCNMFMELPSKKDYPDYYSVIKQPIALDNIKSKIDNKKYQSITQFKADVELMITNAKKYNVKDSQVYDDATQIQKFIKSWSVTKPALKLPGEASNAKSKPTKHKSTKKAAHNPNLKLLMNAVGKKDHKGAMEILERDEDLDPNELVAVEMFGDKFTWSPLHAAAYYGDLKLVEALMAKGGNIELQDTWHSATPLGWAAFGDRDRMVRLLIQKYRANINAENKHGQVPYDVVSDQDDPRWIGLFKQINNNNNNNNNAHTHMNTPIMNNNNSNNSSNNSSNIFRHPHPHQFTPAHNQQMQHIQHLQQQQQQQFLLQQRQLQQQQQQHHHQPQQHHNQQQQQLHQQQQGHSVMNFNGKPFARTDDAQQPIKKRRGRPPKSETDAADVRPTQEIDLRTFDPVGFAVELFNAIRTHTDNNGRLYSELFEDLPNRNEYPDYYKLVKHPRSLSMIADKMEKRGYPDLSHWMTDMKLVFENALNFNVPGSRIFRDAKLLLRLLHRLKERIMAKLAVPVSQEEAAMRINLSNRPFDADALSEDKRKTRRIINRLRNESIEPPEPITTSASAAILHHTLPHVANHHVPTGMNPYLLQQQQQQQQQHQQQLLLQQQQQQQQQHAQQQLQQQHQQQLQQQQLQQQLLLQQQQHQQHQQQLLLQQQQQQQQQHAQQQAAAAAAAAAAQQQQQQMALALANGMSMGPNGAPMVSSGMAMALNGMSMAPAMSMSLPMSMPLNSMAGGVGVGGIPMGLPTGFPINGNNNNTSNAGLLNQSPSMRFDMNNNTNFGMATGPSGFSSASLESSQLDPSSPFSLGRISSEFFNLIKEKGLFFECMNISSNDSSSFSMKIAGDYFGHSITVPSKVHTINISPKLPKRLAQEPEYRRRIQITIIQNNIKLKHMMVTEKERKEQGEEEVWTSVPLSRGANNAIKINITANLTQPESNMPEYKSQVYHLFINQSW